MIIPITIEKAFDKNQNMYRGNMTNLNVVKVLYDKPIANNILNEKNLEQYHLNQEWGRAVHCLHSYSI